MGFLTRYDGELREPLEWRQEVRSPMGAARGSASLLSSHGRGIWPQDGLKKDSRGLSQVAAGNPGFPRLVPVTSGNFSGFLRELRDAVDFEGPFGTPLGLVQWKRASLHLRQEPQGSSPLLTSITGSCGVGTGESGLVLG